MAVITFVALGCGPELPPRPPGFDATRPDAAFDDVGVDAAFPDAWFEAGECGLFDPDFDLIDSADEGRGDSDGDGIPSERDDDSDGDGVLDREEAGDDLCRTPPVSCDQEVPSDRLPDALDVDSDGDGLGDAQEGRSLTIRCDADSDDDGAGDLLEHAFAAWSCRIRGEGCGCAFQATCVPTTEPILHLLDPSGDGTELRVTLELPASLAGTADVEVSVRDAFVGEAMIDPRGLVAEVRPACAAGATDCWTEPAGVSHEAAVAEVTDTQFLGVAPGTLLDFTVTLTSDALPTGPRAVVAAVEIDLVAVGSGVPLDERYIVFMIAAE